MKEGSSKRHRAIGLFSSGGVLIAAVIIALYTPWPGLFDIRRIVVTGNLHASTADLVRLSRLHQGQTLFSISTRRIERELEAHPWIKHASVHRVLPHTVQFTLTERRVVAWIRRSDDGSRVAIGEGGIVVGGDDAWGAADPTLEIVGGALTGWNPGDRMVDGVVADLVEVLAVGVCGHRVERLDVTDLRSVELFLENDIRVQLGDLLGVYARLSALEALGRAIDIDGYERIDVRFGGEATLVPRKAVRR